MAAIPLEVVISATDKFSATANRIAGSMGNLEKSAGRVGRGVGQMAGGLSRLAFVGGAAAVGGLVAITRASVSWESALAGVNKTMDLTPPELQKIGKEIRTLATQIPISAVAIAGLVEQAGALGIAKGDVVAFAEAAATIGVTTNVSADQAATSLGVMSNLLGLTGQDFERFSSALVDAGNKGASTEDQILAIAERAAGAGATIGLTADEILGFASAVANIGIEPEAGGSSLQRVFIDTAKFVAGAGDEIGVFAKTAGLSVKEVSRLFEDDAAGAIEAFVDGLATLNTTDRLAVLESLGWDDIRVTRMLLGLAEAEKKNNNLSDALDITAAAWKSNTAAAEEADKRYGTVASKLSLLKNQAIEGALLIGEGFLPALGRLADKLKVILTDPVATGTLTQLGKDIGAVIDGIDVGKLLADIRGLGVAFKNDVLPVLRTIADVISALPGPIQAAGAALIVAGNTPFVGGALTQIGKGAVNVGLGALGLVGGMLPGKAGQIGSALFAQHVFVTNWPPGLGTGLPGGPGAIPLGPGAIPPARNMPGSGGGFFDRLRGVLPLGAATGVAVNQTTPDSAIGSLRGEFNARLGQFPKQQGAGLFGDHGAAILSATQATRAAIEGKDFAPDVYVTVNPVIQPAPVTIRNVVRQTNIINRYGQIAS